MAKGGKRPGAGRPKGTTGIPQAATIEKSIARELIRQRILARMAPLVDAQLDNAEGIKHFMLRDPETGQFQRLTDPDQIVAALNMPHDEANSHYLIYTKDPSIQAFTDLMNRAIDKPKEQEQELAIDAKVEFVWKTTE